MYIRSAVGLLFVFSIIFIQAPTVSMYNVYFSLTTTVLMLLTSTTLYIRSAVGVRSIHISNFYSGPCAVLRKIPVFKHSGGKNWNFCAKNQNFRSILRRVLTGGPKLCDIPLRYVTQYLREGPGLNAR